jgi:cell division protein ZapA (FtsZ GTPase activity inhibitor)
MNKSNAMSNELIPVNIVIADRTYRIRTNPSDEEVVRKTVKLINDKIIEFKTNFAGKDMQDYIAMVIIWYATQNTNIDNSSVVLEQITETLQKLENQLDTAIG